MRPTKTIEQCITKDFSVDKIKTSEYKESGDFAVIDQGKDLIAGYYSGNKQIYNGELPTIIYGDHTNIVKYIDFPFICGADGVKVLTPKNDIYAKYFYYVLNCVKPETQGYRRHYPLLKNIEIPLPPLETQKAIVAKLDQIFAELDQTKSEIQKNLDNTDELWRSALNQAFQGDWEMKKLGEVIEVLTDYTANGSFASLAEHVQYKDEEDFAVLVRLKDLRKNLKNNDKVYVPEESYNFLKKSSLTGGEYLIANVGANIGDCYEMPFINKPATLGPNMYLVKFNDKVVQRYIVFMTESIIKSQIISNSVSSAQPKINKDQFKNIKIPVPPLSEQEKIVEHLDQVSKEVKALKSQYQSQLDNLEELKKSVLDKAFKGEMGE